MYQIENTALFYMIAPSVDLRGDWELNDLTTVEESYQEGDLRDGLGFLTWVESFNDTTTEAGQIKALANFTKFKYPIDTTVLQLRKGLLDSLAVWGTSGAAGEEGESSMGAARAAADDRTARGGRGGRGRGRGREHFPAFKRAVLEVCDPPSKHKRLAAAKWYLGRHLHKPTV